MTARRLLWAGRRVLAATALACFLVGGPVVLHWLGSPLPARWPSWARFVTDVRIGYIPSSAPGKLAVGAGWALWGFLGYEVLAETWSHLRHHVGRAASAMGPLQPAVSKIVAALLLSAPVAARSWPAGALSPPTVAIVPGPPGIFLRAEPSVGPSPQQASAAEAQAAAPGDLPTYVVQPRDTLWGIAERLLGDPLRWSEIAALNEGRAEATGRFGDPHWIQPGWLLLLPADAGGRSSRSAASAPPSAAPSAQSQVSVATIPPGLTSVASQSPGSEVPPTTAPAVSSVRSEPVADPREAVVHRPRSPVAPIGYGLLAAGVIGMLDRMRRAQQRRRPRGLHIRLPDGELSDVERGLRALADTPLGSSVDTAMRLLATLVLEGACEPPAVVAVRCGPQTLELVLDDPAVALASSPPAPFRATPGGTWTLDRQWLAGLSPERRRLVSEVEAPLPALVTLGADADDTVLVDVERMGSLSVTGAEAAMVLQGMVVELATLPWADGVEVVVVGHPSQLSGLERVRQAPTIAGLLREMTHRTAGQRSMAVDVDAPGTIEARWRRGGDGWDPVVVVCLPPAADAEPEAAMRLVALAGDGADGRGVAVAVGAAIPARWSVLADEGTVRLRGPDETTSVSARRAGGALAVTPAASALLDSVDALVAVADLPAVEGPVPHAPWQVRAEAATDADEVAPEVEVQILGPVAVAGGARPFSRAWSLELVIYLAMHPAGASTDQWATALWPDRIMAPASLHSTASAARRSLGVSASGVDHLPRAHGRLSLGPSVTSDWARLQSLAASDTPERWAEGLRLVRGRPFETLRAADWAVLEGTVAAIEAAVVDLASRYAHWCLQSGDPAGAEWAARQGLRVSPYDERLYRVLLRAADAAGNPAGVEAAMEELVRLVAEDVEPYDAVHRETWDLYRSLTRRARFGGGSARADQAPSPFARVR